MEVVSTKTKDYWLICIEHARDNIRKCMYKYLSEDAANICIALTIGEKDNLDDSIKDSFIDAGLSHIIAISGMHTIYVATIAAVSFKWIGKRKSYGACIVVLCLFCCLAHNSESVFRATFMLSMFFGARILYRKSDSVTNLCFATMLALFLNPFCVYSMGFLMSSAGTVGIIVLSKRVNKPEIKSKWKSYIVEQIRMGFCSNLVLMPITAKSYNKVSLMFLLTSPVVNLLISILMPVLLVFMVLGIVGDVIPGFILGSLGWFVNILAMCLIKIAMIFQNISFLNFKVITPSSVFIILYYTLLILFFMRKYKSKYVSKIMAAAVGIYLIICIIGQTVYFSNKDFVMYMVDVGQGDCVLCVTPDKKMILVDGGGKEGGKDNVGKQIVVPFLRNKAITKIDYIIISHFDTDHVGGILTVLEELKVGTVFISPQGEDSANHSKFKQIVQQRHINVSVVGKGDSVNIEKNVRIDFLWPDKSNLISENVLNNNSIVCKLTYNKFSCLFTGDVEAVAEEKILECYKEKSNALQSTVLKVGHHGSKTSSTKALLDKVKPKIALIGVGKENKFGHPNDYTIESLKQIGTSIYRTDQMGQITINIDSAGHYKIKKYV